MELLAGCQNTGLISYLQHPNDWEYFQNSFRLLKKVKWLNYFEGKFNWLSTTEINELLNKSCVGLCLSQIEGAMYASIEYLYCGLPLISTPSHGGRAEFFDPEYTLIVPDDVDSIADAVQTHSFSCNDPWLIRKKTLNHIDLHRNTYNQIICKILSEYGYMPSYNPIGIIGNPVNRLCTWQSEEDIAAAIKF